MAAFFVTGSGTDIGKTYISAGLLAYWRGRRLSPDALKPLVSGFDEADPAGSDPAVLLAALGRGATPAALEAMSPVRLKAPLSADQAAVLEGRTLTLAALAEPCRRAIEAARGPLLIEGAGGVMSPINDHQTMLDLIADLDLPVLFVAGSYLGALSHALTGLAALRAHRVTVAAIVVNESGQGSVGLKQTIASLASQFRAAPIMGLPRNAGDSDWARLTTMLDT